MGEVVVRQVLKFKVRSFAFILLMISVGLVIQIMKNAFDFFQLLEIIQAV